MPAALRRLGQQMGLRDPPGSHDDYQPSVLPDRVIAGTQGDALDTACGLYLGDPTAWITPPRD